MYIRMRVSDFRRCLRWEPIRVIHICFRLDWARIDYVLSCACLPSWTWRGTSVSCVIRFWASLRWVKRLGGVSSSAFVCNNKLKKSCLYIYIGRHIFYLYIVEWVNYSHMKRRFDMSFWVSAERFMIIYYYTSRINTISFLCEWLLIVDYSKSGRCLWIRSIRMNITSSKGVIMRNSTDWRRIKSGKLCVLMCVLSGEKSKSEYIAGKRNYIYTYLSEIVE